MRCFTAETSRCRYTATTMATTMRGYGNRWPGMTSRLPWVLAPAFIEGPEIHWPCHASVSASAPHAIPSCCPGASTVGHAHEPQQLPQAPGPEHGHQTG